MTPGRGGPICLVFSGSIKNYFYYHNPLTDKFEVHPWDLDLTWANNMFGRGNHDSKTKVAQNTAFYTRDQIRVREI